MCRFALVRTTALTQPQDFLNRFADVAQASRAPDGDIQGDGWGMSWREGSGWKCHADSCPIWEARETFSRFAETKLFLVHARSASFTKDKNNVEYSQPYVSNNLAFVFNGLLKGMKFPRPLVGDIGAQRIWSLLLEFTSGNETKTAIEMTTKELNKYAREVQALNLGVSDGEKLYVYSQSSSYKEYYTLHIHTDPGITIVSSEPLWGETFKSLEPNRVHVFE
jgi:predicted glutamine amidotransferase